VAREVSDADSDPGSATARDDSSAPASLPGPDSLATDRSFLDDALAAADAVGFVAVGGRFDADLRYLTRFGALTESSAYVRTAGTDVLCAPSGPAERVAERFDGRVATDRLGDPIGVRAAAALAELLGNEAGGTILVPATIPHDAAVYLERAGYELQSTAAVAAARATKAPDEIAAIRGVQRAAAAGLRRVERVLAAAENSETDGQRDQSSSLRWEDGPLTAERLRRAVNAELAACGVRSAGNTAISVGRDSSTGRPGPPADTNHAAAPQRSLRAGEPIRVTVAPRGPHGYHGALTRTFVVDSDGGWERRAHVAVDSALDAALSVIEPGATPATVAREADAELAAFGFGPTSAADGDSDGPLTSVYGVGLEQREAPTLDENTELEAGMVVAVAPGVCDAERGCIRLGDLVVVTDDGGDLLVDASRSFVPRK
jgi:Xaa-Pro aminopeptidase